MFVSDFLQVYKLGSAAQIPIAIVATVKTEDLISESPVKCEETFLSSTNQTGGILHNGYRFHKSGVEKKGITYYRCAQKRKTGCQTALNIDRQGEIRVNNMEHNHPTNERKTTKLTGKKIYHKNFPFYRHSVVHMGGAVRWRCCTKKCKAIVLTDSEGSDVLTARNEHSPECVVKYEIN